MNQTRRELAMQQLRTQWQQRLRECQSAMNQLRKSMPADQMLAVNTAEIDATMGELASRAPEPVLPPFAMRV